MKRLVELLTEDDIARGQELLRTLHRRPELSGEEVWTAGQVAELLTEVGADEVLTDIGTTGTSRSHGVLARFGPADGVSVLLRCELDALPIQEEADLPYRSQVGGRAHLCGHDGHMSILLTVARVLGRGRAEHRGAANPRSACPTIWLLFQPAEETGTGGRAVCSDSRFADLEIRRSYALHNLPGFPVGATVVRSGTMCCASAGVAITLAGRAAHAAQPETGQSPARALADLIHELEQRDDPPGVDFATVVGARLGQRAFGTAPDCAELFVTLRSPTDAGLSSRLESLREMVRELAERDGLNASAVLHDEFRATVNDAAEADRIRRVAAALAQGGQPIEPPEPFRWSEDFGEISSRTIGALVGLGAGESTRPLHDPEYVFPEELIGRGARLWLGLLDDLADRPP